MEVENVKGLVSYSWTNHGEICFEARTLRHGLLSIPQQTFSELLVEIGDWISADISLPSANKSIRNPVVRRVEKIPPVLPGPAFVVPDPENLTVSAGRVCLLNVPAILTRVNSTDNTGVGYSEELGKIIISKGVDGFTPATQLKVKDIILVSVMEVSGEERYRVKDAYWVATNVRPGRSGLSERDFPSLQTYTTRGIAELKETGTGYGCFLVSEVGRVFFAVADCVEFNGRNGREILEELRKGHPWELLAAPAHYARPTTHKALLFSRLESNKGFPNNYI